MGAKGEAGGLNPRSKAPPAPEPDGDPAWEGLLPEIDVPFPAENPLTSLDEALLQSLVESVDYARKPKREPVGPTMEFTLPPPAEIVDAFRTVWTRLARELGLDVDADRALLEMRDLVVYSMPDGTRSTLTVPPTIDVDLDAGLFCLGLVHALKSLGARTTVVMTHTTYNRARGSEEQARILRVLARAVEPVAQYAARHRVQVRIVGLESDPALAHRLEDAFPRVQDPAFEAHFLVNYEEEMFLGAGGRAAMDALPEVDVAIRHTKFNMSGGWLPRRMVRSSLVYCQNGSLFSNWSDDEYAAMAAVCLLSKKLMTGEGLSKTYLDIDDVKRRYQLRELNLFQRTVRLRPEPRKLFVVGSPIGLYQVYY